MSRVKAPQAETFMPQEDEDIESLFDKLEKVTEVVISIQAQIDADDFPDPLWKKRACGARQAYVISKSALEKEIRYRERHQLASLISEEAKSLITSQFGFEAWAGLCQRAELKFIKAEEGKES